MAWKKKTADGEAAEKPVKEKKAKEPKAKKEKPVREKKEKPVKEKKAKPMKEKPVKEKKAKPVKEKPAKQPKAAKEKPAKEKKPGLMDKFKKKKNGDEDGMDILTEVKEPFSFSTFFEEHVMEKFRRAKRILQDRGVLFFLFSPFQARARLIAELMILVLGILFGVVPRATTLVNALQQEAYASEIAGLKQTTVGTLTITPAASSNYKRVHMLAFELTGKNLPSDASKYEVYFAASASDGTDITYSWNVYPVDSTTRILLLSIDQTKQSSGYTRGSLFIQVKDDEKVSKYAKETGCYEITLSSAQPTSELYDKTGVHLSATTATIAGSGKIAAAQEELQTALDLYQKAVEQAEAMPIGVTVTPTADDLETYCLANRVYRALKDDSNTEDILTITDTVSSQSALPNITKSVTLTANGIGYDSERIAEINTAISENGVYSEEEKAIAEQYDNVQQKADSVCAAMKNVNTAAYNWYSTLDSYKLVLNQTINTTKFPLYARALESIDSEINYIDGSEVIEDSTEGGLTGSFSGDDADPVVTPSTETPDDSQAAEEPVQEPVEEPVQETPAEEPVEETPAETPSSSTESESTKTTTYVGHQQTGSAADNK